jgi:ELP3 family radical SAM enzyme/protein acetyltransferase
MDIEEMTGNNEDMSMYGIDHLLFNDDDTEIQIHNIMEEPITKLIYALLDLIRNNQVSDKDFRKTINAKSKELNMKKSPRFSHINIILKKLFQNNKVSHTDYTHLIEYTLAKKSRGTSGMFQVAVMTSGIEFSCEFDCHYCPKQEGMPRSYVAHGPSARRANQWNQDCVKQIHSRLTSYCINGHLPDKLEIIVLGGTWSSYSMEYRRKFINEVFYGVNTFYMDKTKGPVRNMLTLSEEQELNTNGKCKIIGLTIETRPDGKCIIDEEIASFLEFGVTRVQIGIQTTHNKILKLINRQCTIEECYTGIKLLKDAGLKVMCHYMPNLPGSTPELDRIMLEEAVFNPMLDCDEFKIYPTMVPTTSDKDDVPVVTVIEKWYKDGKYIPYSDDELQEVLINFKRIPELNTKRIARLFRDIPKPNTVAGCDSPNMRETLKKEMTLRGYQCQCIRCREIGTNPVIIGTETIDYKEYPASDGTEWFISINSADKKHIIGFTRVRFPSNNTIRAFVRELHVYGVTTATFGNVAITGSQHRGFGQRLIKMAETIAMENGFTELAITSGVGVRNYYKNKLGYALKDHYMVKSLIPKDTNSLETTIIHFILKTIVFIIITILLFCIINLFQMII